jgi:5-methylcytosine-specific restriction protein A
MTIAPPRPCAKAGCRRLAVAGGRCRIHLKPAWHPAAAPPPARIRGRALQDARAALFAAHPYCVACLALGRHTRATIRDHRIPLAEGGPDDATNVQPLCQAHSDHKTRAEARRGRARWRSSVM